MSDDFKETEIGRIPKEWKIKRFDECISTPKPSPKNIPKSQFKLYGKYPIIDQGAEFISGYTNDYNMIFKYPLPVIIFGDHTRIFKFINFTFAIGADGTKILIPKTKNLDGKFLYFQFISFKIQNRGYNRHFRLLRKFLIKVPPLEEQERIAYVLSKIQNAIGIQDKLIKLLQELKKTMMHKLFTEGIGHTDFKDIEIGRIPKEWEIKTLKDISTIITGNTPSKANKEYWQNGKIEFIKPPDLKNEVIKTYSEMISYSAKSKARIIPRNSVLVSCIGIIGRVGYTNKEIAFNQQINGLILSDKIAYYLYVFYVLQYEKKQFEILASKTTVPIINKSKFSTILIPLPPLEEQKRMADILSTIDNKISIENKRKESFEKLFKTALNKLMTGQIRTKNMEMVE